MEVMGSKRGDGDSFYGYTAGQKQSNQPKMQPS